MHMNACGRLPQESPCDMLFWNGSRRILLEMEGYNEESCKQYKDFVHHQHHRLDDGLAGRPEHSGRSSRYGAKESAPPGDIPRRSRFLWKPEEMVQRPLRLVCAGCFLHDGKCPTSRVVEILFLDVFFLCVGFFHADGENHGGHPVGVEVVGIGTSAGFL